MDGSLTLLWSSCRLIGFINMIYFCIKIYESLRSLKRFTWMIFKYSDDSINLNEESITHMKIECIIAVLVILLYIKLAHVNYGITSRNALSDGSKSKTWLYSHMVLLCIFVVHIVIQFSNKPKNEHEVYMTIVSTIILLIEIMVVGKFYKAVNTSVDGRNMEFQTSTV